MDKRFIVDVCLTGKWNIFGCTGLQVSECAYVKLTMCKCQSNLMGGQYF